MINKVSENAIVKSTPINKINAPARQQAPVAFLADMIPVDFSYTTAPKLQPLRYDVFVPAYRQEIVLPQANISFMQKVVNFLGLKK